MSEVLEDLERWGMPPGPCGAAAHWQPWLRAERRPGFDYAPVPSPPAARSRGRVLCGVRVPPELEGLARIIDQSRWMLNLAPDWDGQGSPPYAESTWERAGALLLGGAVDYVARSGRRIPGPAFENGPEGSIDILWEGGESTLLLNVPADADAPVRYYGRSGGGSEVKGTVSYAEWRKWFPLLMQWLLE